MNSSDKQMMAVIERNGLRIEEMFLAGGHVYSSKDAGDFQVESTYERLSGLAPSDEAALVAFLRRFGVPEYASIDDVEDKIARVKEWEVLYDRLGELLERHGTQDPFGNGDFYLVDDDYGDLQHKIECTSEKVITPSLVAEIQRLLSSCARRWEVIFALPAVKGRDHAFSVYANAVVEHND